MIHEQEKLELLTQQQEIANNLIELLAIRLISTKTFYSTTSARELLNIPLLRAWV